MLRKLALGASTLLLATGNAPLALLIGIPALLAGGDGGGSDSNSGYGRDDGYVSDPPKFYSKTYDELDRTRQIDLDRYLKEKAARNGESYFGF